MEGNEGLSPEELAAMDGDEETNSDEFLEAVAGSDEVGGGETDGEDAGETQAEGAGEAAAAVAVIPEPAAVAAAVADPAHIVVPENLPAVAFQFRDDGKVLPEFAPEFAKLDEQYEEGNLSLSAYNAQRDALKAQMNNVKADGQLWQAECETFWRHNKDWRPGTPLFDMLDGEVKRLAASEQSQGLTGLQMIYAAQARVSKALVALQPQAGKQQATAAAAAGKDEGKRPASPRPSAVAHALGAMPAAAAAEVGGGEFAHLDTLAGLDLERAVAALSPEARERWTMEN